MAKLVCDFSQVTAIGEKLCTTASDISSSIDDYANQMDSDLTSWTGSAKNAFQTTSNGQVKIVKADAEYVNNLGGFIKQAAQNIETLEEELANLDI